MCYVKMNVRDETRHNIHKSAALHNALLCIVTRLISDVHFHITHNRTKINIQFLSINIPEHNYIQAKGTYTNPWKDHWIFSAHIWMQRNCVFVPLRQLHATWILHFMQEWRYAAGWTKYDNETGAAIPVDFPEEDALVFDIEVLVREGHFPTMATALSHKHWYDNSQVIKGMSVFLASRDKCPGN